MTCRTPTAGKNRPRGYVLLAVLACLVVAIVALAGLAQRSLQLSTTALVRQRELQQRWGAASCQRTLLPAAPRLFARLQEQAQERSASGPAPSTLTNSVLLGGVRFDLLLADENAKLNLNIAYHHLGRLRAEQFAKRNLRGAALTPIRLFPAAQPVDPLEALEDDRALPQALASWGQVFDYSRAINPESERWRLPQTTSRATLWGSGSVNVRRAPDATVLEACQLVVSQASASQLLRRVRDRPKQNVALHIDQLGVDQDEQMLLEELFTENSSCFSLWTTAQRTHAIAQRFAVLEIDEEGVARTVEFEF